MPFSENFSYFVFQIFCKNRDKVLIELKKNGIGVSVHYTNPLHKMSYYKNKYKIRNTDFLNSNNYSDTNISLPMYPALKNNEINYICKKLNEIIYE